MQNVTNLSSPQIVNFLCLRLFGCPSPIFWSAVQAIAIESVLIGFPWNNCTRKTFIYFLLIKKKQTRLFIEHDGDDDANKTNIQIKIDRVGRWTRKPPPSVKFISIQSRRLVDCCLLCLFLFVASSEIGRAFDIFRIYLLPPDCFEQHPTKLYRITHATAPSCNTN